jgi:8-oxo-dGTP pyrophosphatase MutT (NUDIX family)
MTKDTPAVDESDPQSAPPGERRADGPSVRPRDAATLIILRGAQDVPRVLLGKRSAGHAFMPNKLVFPGGTLELADSRIRPPRDLHPAVQRRLCRGCSGTRARALALAAIRETYEETGLLLGERATPGLRSRSPHWAHFLRQGVVPRLDVLHYIARAITPPHRSRRFDARFFLVDAEHIQGEAQEQPAGSGELLDLQWLELSRAVDMAQLPLITRTVLRELQRRLREGHDRATAGPFVYYRRGRTVVDAE